MAGPKHQSTLDWVIAPGESDKLYTPAGLAFRVENFVWDDDGYLRSIRGPANYEPARTNPVVAAFSFGRFHGLHHASLLAGQSDMLLVRAGTQLYRHAGWNSRAGTAFASLLTGLSDEQRPAYPDMFVNLHDKVIWTNGIDRAQVISHDGMVVPLGFDRQPDAPSPQGPSMPDALERDLYSPNSRGYSWPGHIGSVGDLLSGREGALLASAHYYWAMWEDIHGNLSPMSVISSAVTLQTQSTVPLRDNSIGPLNPNRDYQDMRVEIDDLLRQFIVRFGGDAPSHAVALHLLRSPDARRNPTEPRLVTRIPGTSRTLYPDNIEDSGLGPVYQDNAAVPIFRVMTTHQGCLVIGNFLNDPAMVRKSAPGFPGTFPKNQWVYPDSGGAEITALTSHGDRLLAFTETSVYDLSDFGNPVALAQTIGCVAPRSIQALPDGTLVWLGRDGFYGLSPSGQIDFISSSIQSTIDQGLNQGRVRMAVASVDSASGEYRCAVTPAGFNGNRLVLCYDGVFWRRLEMLIEVEDICVTDDWRRYQLVAGRDISANERYILVMDREMDDYTPPTREYVYRSGWLRADPQALRPINVREMAVGQADGSDNNATITFYRDGSFNPAIPAQNLRTLGQDLQSRVVTDIAGVAVIGTSKVHDRRIFWRRVGVNLNRVHTWAFEIRSSTPINLQAFAFEVSHATKGSPFTHIPKATDDETYDPSS